MRSLIGNGNYRRRAEKEEIGRREAGEFGITCSREEKKRKERRREARDERIKMEKRERTEEETDKRGENDK
jgi:hypothetical protein